MRAFLDLVEQITDGLRVIVGLFVVLVLGSVLIMTLGATYAVSEVTSEIATIADEAQKEGSEIRRSQTRAERERALAKEGWGYQATDDGFGEEAGPKSDRRRKRRARDSDWGRGN